MDPPDLKRTKRQERPARSSFVDRLPPHSPEAEQCVLGCMLIDPKKCIPECAEALTGPDAFYDLRHQTIYSELVRMSDGLISVDTVTLYQCLRDRQLAEQCGGVSYISNLVDLVPSVLNLPAYLDTLSQKHLLREALKACTEAVGRIYDCEHDAEGTIDDLERSILAVRSRRSRREVMSMKDLTMRAISYIEQLHLNKGVLTGLPTGFPELDKMTMGLNGGDMIVLCAYPSVGKTSLAMNVVEFVSIELKQPVGVFSAEMTADSLTMRLLCSKSRVNLRNVREGFLAERDFPKITHAAGKLSGAAVYIDDTSEPSIFQIRARARRLWQQHGIKLFVIDYLQLLNARGSTQRFEKRSEELEAISRGIKGLAKELDVPIIVLSQLNDDGRVLGSRAPGQDGDHVWYLVRKKSSDKADAGDDLDQECTPVDLEIRKQRNGPTGKVPLMFLKAYTRFESAAKISDIDVPSQASMNYPQ